MRLLSLPLATLLLLGSGALPAAELHVPAQFATVQAAIDAAAPGDEVVVAPGRHFGNVAIVEKDIVLRSQHPASPEVVRATELVGLGGPVIALIGDLTEASRVEGLTITGGSALFGGGILGTEVRTTIRNCVLFDNEAIVQQFPPHVTGGTGSAIYGCDGLIVNCLIYRNRATQGAAVDECEGTLQSSVIHANGGLGVAGTNLRLSHSIVWANTEGQVDLAGALPIHSCIEGWRGGGRGNTNADPGFVDPDAFDFRLRPESPLIDAGALIRLAGDRFADFEGEQRMAGAEVDIGPDEFASATDADGDLASDAMEIAAGTDPLNPDTDGDGVIDGKEILAGRNAFAPDGPQALTVNSGESLQRAVFLSTPGSTLTLAPGTHRDNLLMPGHALHLVGDTATLEAEAPNPAIAMRGTANDGSTLTGLAVRGGRAFHGAGLQGNGAAVDLTDCRLVGGAANEGAAVHGIAGDLVRCEVSGGESLEPYIGGPSAAERVTGAFRECRFVSTAGVGIRFSTGDVLHCEFTGLGGAALFAQRGDIIGCRLSGNAGGIESSRGDVFDCVLQESGGILRQVGDIVSNEIADGSGYGVQDSRGQLARNHIHHNLTGGVRSHGGDVVENLIEFNGTRLDETAPQGGIFFGGGALARNVIRFNAGFRAGGVTNWGGPILSNVIHGNTSPAPTPKRGAAVNACNGLIAGNTIHANEGAGLLDCGGANVSNIVWANSLGQISRSATPEFSCIQDWTGPGAGNIADDPLFADAQAGDLRLMPGSPCIDAGGFTDLLSLDVEGNLRGWDAVAAPRGDGSDVDIGAYEFDSLPADLLILDHLLGRRVLTLTLLLTADLNLDGVVNVADLVLSQL